MKFIWVILNAIVWTTIFGLSGIFISLFESNKGYALGHCARLWGKFILFFCGVTYKISGLKNLDPNGNYIFAGNHASGFDIPLAFAGLPYWLISIAKIELKSIFILGWVMSKAGHIFVDRSKSEKAMASINHSKSSLLKNPRSILLFPEGTRTLDGTLQKFKKGGLSLALETGIPIVPVAFVGTFELLPKGSWKVKSNPIEIHVGVPISPGLYSSKDRATLTRDVESRVEILLKKSNPNN